MPVRTWFPRPPLSDFVELLWFAEGTPATHAKERLLPTGTMELVLNLRDDAMSVYESQNTKRLYFLRVGKEEKMMGEEFGGEYEQYLRKRGRLVRKLWGD